MLERYRWPILLGGLSLVFFILATWIFIQGFGGWSASFTGPGTVTITVPSPGDYRLWHESRTVIDGQLQVLDDALPSGTVIRARSPNGATAAVEPMTGSMSHEWDGRRRFAVGRLYLPEAGPYTVSTTGFDQPRRFQLSEIRFLDHFLKALGLGLIGSVLATVALVRAVILASKSS